MQREGEDQLKKWKYVLENIDMDEWPDIFDPILDELNPRNGGDPAHPFNWALAEVYVEYVTKSIKEKPLPTWNFPI